MMEGARRKRCIKIGSVLVVNDTPWDEGAGYKEAVRPVVLGPSACFVHAEHLC